MGLHAGLHVRRGTLVVCSTQYLSRWISSCLLSCSPFWASLCVLIEASRRWTGNVTLVAVRVCMGLSMLIGRFSLLCTMLLCQLSLPSSLCKDLLLLRRPRAENIWDVFEQSFGSQGLPFLASGPPCVPA